MGTLLGLIGLISMGISIYRSYLAAGNVDESAGVVSLFSLIFAVTGLILGGVTIRNRDYYRLFPRLAILLNLCLLIVLGFVLRLSIY